MRTREEFHTITKNNASYQKKLLKYLFQCIISEGSKIILFAVFFYHWHRFSEFIVALLALTLLRTNGGGIHFQHYTSCLLMSFFMLLGSIVLAIYVPVPDIVLKLTTIICAALGYFFVPVVSANRPPASDSLIWKSKRNTLLIILGYLILICAIPNNRYIYIGYWTITLHIWQLLIAKYFKEGGKCHA